MDFRKLVFGVLVALASVACGGSEPGDDPNPSGTGGGGGGGGGPAKLGNLLPWKEGNTWTYRVTDDAGVSTVKRTIIGGVEPVGGTGPNKDRMANKVTTQKDDTGGAVDLDETVSWRAVEGERVVRYREQAFGRTTNQLELEEHWDAHKLHVDSSAEKTTPGATWLESYKETKLPAGGTPVYDVPVNDRWFADRIESVTVPAGTFEALVLRKVSAAGAAKTYWYAPGIGKIKETGGQTEELMEYELK